MKAVVWHGTEDVRVDEVADPSLQEPTDAIVRITSTAICGMQSQCETTQVREHRMAGGPVRGRPTRRQPQVHIPMGQANVRAWVDDLLPFVLDDADPLGTED